MAKFKPIEVLKSLSGKVCGHSDMYFAVKKGTRYTGKICNPRTKAYSADELARQSKFAAATAAVKALTSEQKAVYAEAFAGQSKYTTMFGYCFHLEWLAFED